MGTRRAEILKAQDLSKKGRIQRQCDYAGRNALKALRTVVPIHLAHGFTVDAEGQECCSGAMLAVPLCRR
jgi:hypothetical protein